MTPVTKIFVVLVCLFAFIFTPLTIGFVAQTYNWKTLAEQYNSKMEAALAVERATLGSAASAISHYEAVREADRQTIRDLQNEKAALEQDRQDRIQAIEACEASRASWESSAQTLAAQLKVIVAKDEALSAENKRLADSEQDLRARNDDLQDRVEELSANSVTLAQQLKQKGEELTAVRQENEQLRQKLRLGKPDGVLTSAAEPSARPETPVAAHEIRGSVTQVQPSEGLASVDVGSSAGLAKGMVMAVIRGSEYICDLVITDKVDPTQAVGKIVNQGGKEIRPGDTVVDEQSLMAR